MKDHISEEEKRIEPNRQIPFCFVVTCVFFYFNCLLQNKVPKANTTQLFFFSLFFCPELDFVPLPKKKKFEGQNFLSNGFTLRLHWEKLPKTTIEFLLPTHDAKNREESSTGEFLTTLARLNS